MLGVACSEDINGGADNLLLLLTVPDDHRMAMDVVHPDGNTHTIYQAGTHGAAFNLYLCQYLII